MVTLTTVTLKYVWESATLGAWEQKNVTPLLPPHILPLPPHNVPKEGAFAEPLQKFCLTHWCLETDQTVRVFRSALKPKDLFLSFNCSCSFNRKPCFRSNINSSWPLLISPLSPTGLSTFVFIRTKLSDSLPSRELSSIFCPQWGQTYSVDDLFSYP